jgi:purine-binding chemotaxis protein CheW
MHKGAAMTETMTTGAVLAGKYLTFKVAEEEYGIQILKVQEIIPMQSITKVPKMPEFVRGVINLRGKVIPVIQLRSKFGLASAADNEKTCVIVVQIGNSGAQATLGVVIDEVKEVLDIKADSIEDTPSFGGNVNTDLLLGMSKIGTSVKILLDIDRVLTAEEIVRIKQPVAS